MGWLTDFVQLAQFAHWEAHGRFLDEVLRRFVGSIDGVNGFWRPLTYATYALNYARDMDRDLADRFVGMYVNDWTLDYGPRGREAVRRLLDEGHRAGVIPSPTAVEFVE